MAQLPFVMLALAMLLMPLPASARPNFILFIADDMAWEDCGAYGNRAVRTPHLDWLARERNSVSGSP